MELAFSPIVLLCTSNRKYTERRSRFEKMNTKIVKYASECIQHKWELSWNKSQSDNILMLGRDCGVPNLLGVGRNLDISY